MEMNKLFHLCFSGRETRCFYSLLCIRHLNCLAKMRTFHFQWISIDGNCLFLNDRTTSRFVERHPSVRPADLSLFIIHLANHQSTRSLFLSLVCPIEQALVQSQQTSLRSCTKISSSWTTYLCSQENFLTKTMIGYCFVFYKSNYAMEILTKRRFLHWPRSLDYWRTSVHSITLSTIHLGI